MKTRNAFVANSSSSSFIIAYRDINVVTDSIKPDWVRPMIAKMMEALTRNADRIETVEDLNAYFVGYYGCRDESIEDVLAEDEDLRERYGHMVAAIEKGYIIADVDVDNHDEWSGDFFGGLPKNKLNEPITLVYSWG